MGRPFEKGDSRINRKGRPRKGAALTDILSYKLDQKTDDGKLHREAVADKLIALAEAGDVPALKYLVDRLDGKPRQSVLAEVAGGISMSLADMAAVREKLGKIIERDD